MIHKPRTTRFLIIAFMIIVGYCFARGIYYQSTMAIILAFISLGAGIYFIHLLGKAKEELEAEEVYRRDNQ